MSNADGHRPIVMLIISSFNYVTYILHLTDTPKISQKHRHTALSEKNTSRQRRTILHYLSDRTYKNVSAKLLLTKHLLKRLIWKSFKFLREMEVICCNPKSSEIVHQ